ncbi:MAG: nicotinate (nicotinamide) nucleotide adenylyltransferase [Oscillospiraceae bacterium]|nr:nicotinate (nicotinamide) nucleotide adenylyltransferase [Oscillospiraceae bacterium]
MGGTFNPLHNGHLLLAKGVAEVCGFERVMLIPTNVPPHKAAPDLASAEHRLEFCRLAAEEDSLFWPQDIEIKREGKSYTIDTLEELAEIYPDEEFALIMGADMFLTLHQWMRWKDILKCATVCGVKRKGVPSELDEYAEGLRELGAKIMLPETDVPEVSSTQLREMLKNGEDVGELIPKNIADYIYENGLYRKNQEL